MEEKFSYKCSLETFFEDYLRLKRPYINAVLSTIHKKERHLNDNPLRVLAQLLYYNYVYRDIEESMRWKIVFDYDTKIKICDRLKMPNTHLNSYLSQLRRIGIVKKKSVDKFWVFYPEKNIKLMFDISVDMGDEE